MTDFSLYNRITIQGTISEPKGVPDPSFSLPSNVNWMRGLGFLVHHHNLNFKSAKAFYSSTVKKTFSTHEENSIFEQLLFAVHQVSALEALTLVPRRADIARMGIVTWYYGIYAAASAMVTAQDGSFQDNHTGTAATWDRLLASRNLVMPPFNLRVSTLVEKEADAELIALRGKNDRFVLTSSPPANAEQAYGACVAYLSGNVNYWRWSAIEDIKTSREFKDLGVTDFRKKIARELRDKRLAKRSVAFHHQAFRYRGKANYRDAIFLGYGTSTETLLTNYVDDLSIVLNGFVAAAGAFCSKRLGTPTWDNFVNDLEANRAFSASPKNIWT